MLGDTVTIPSTVVLWWQSLDEKMNRFAEYVTNQSFVITLSQPMINAFIWQMSGSPGHVSDHTNSLWALERRGLVEYSCGGWTTTIAGWKVYDLIKIAGLLDSKELWAA